ncbi:MAG TPA: DNA topoisomerase IB [Thermomicrobiales bacterium]|nr:DNA topoisomerase IB [Thermomicrobiales bacterium]
MLEGEPTVEAVAVADPEESAREAGLRYILDDRPGITRRRAGKGFSYRDPNGERMTDTKVIERIKSLAIPPAWTEVWICPSPKGHLQATGRDAKGRKQYRYHPRWREVRDENKYEHVLAFGKALPSIRERVDADLRKHGLPKEKVLALVVRLLETTLIRVGNDQYAKENKSFGLTTMRDRHADIHGSTITFEFSGKGGIEHEVDLRDRRLARIVKQCQDIPGQHLFQYVDDEGNRQPIDSDDVNAYLKEITGADYTAKDFRTWAGTKLAAEALAEFEEFDSETAAKKNVVDAIERVAGRLGNTTTICRKCYVHPAIIDAYMDGDTVESIRQRAGQELAEHLADLDPEEAAVLMLLHERLEENGSR